MPTYKILALDGGGIRGVFTVALIQKLEERTHFLSAVDLFAGTSTGGLLALALAAEINVQAIIDMYRTKGTAIFNPRAGNVIARAHHGLMRARYSAGALEEAVTAVLGERRLGDLPRKVLVPTFVLDDRNPDPAARTWRAKFFHNFAVTDPNDTDDRGQLAVAVALRTTAAPTYFPARDGYIDGGVVANSPALAAIAQALDSGTGGRQLTDLRLLALGTGVNHTYIATPRSPDWGLLQWGPSLIDLFMDGAMGVVDYQCNRLLGDNHYRRLAPVLPGNRAIRLDDTDAIDALIEFADTVSESDSFTDVAAWLAGRFR
jgi:patatin-like phospholipase/acyl hydrolase